MGPEPKSRMQVPQARWAAVEGLRASMGPEPKSRMQAGGAGALASREKLQWGLNRSPGCRTAAPVPASCPRQTLQWGLNRSPGCRPGCRTRQARGAWVRGAASMGPEPKSRMQALRPSQTDRHDVRASMGPEPKSRMQEQLESKLATHRWMLQWGLNRSPGCRIVAGPWAVSHKGCFNGA